jgi:DNA-binding beta-propeller fold protein YncE
VLSRRLRRAAGDDITTWTLTNAVYSSDSFSVATQETALQSLFFKPDGTKMYIIGRTGDDVNEYDLSTAWDVTSASYLQLFSVSAQETDPIGLFFKPDGTKMYVVGYQGDDVNEYDLSTAWDVTSASYLQLFSVSSQDTNPGVGLFFKPDGTKMYVTGLVGQDINEYNLSTAWDVTSASYLQLFEVHTQDLFPSGLFFKDDGTKMFVTGYHGDDVNEYNLSTAWDVTSASYVQNFSVSGQDTTPQGIFFKPDGTQMYIAGTSGNTVYSYNL